MTQPRALLFLTFLVIAVFGGTVRNGFVWDDSLISSGRALEWFDFKTILFSLQVNGLEYLPVRDVSYALDFALWGKNPAGFHISNLLYYLLNCIAVYFLATRLALYSRTERPYTPDRSPVEIGLFCAALFAVHPLHCEVVSFITCRNTLLSGIFFFVACIAWLEFQNGPQNRRNLWYAVALASCTCSFFSKATGVILPLLLLLFTCNFDRSRRGARFAALLPFFALSALVSVMFIAIARHADVIPRGAFCATTACITEKASMALQIPVFYLYKFFVPVNYSADYGEWFFDSSLSSPIYLVSMFIAGSLVLAVWFFRENILQTVGVVWFMVALLPVLNFFDTSPLVADRYAYLPSFGLCLLSVATAARMPDRLFRSGMVLLVVVLSLATFRQNQVWRDEKNLWTHTLATNPVSVVALAELGRVYFWEERDFTRAMGLFQRLSSIEPLNPAVDLHQGHLCMMMQDYPCAVAAFSRAVDRDDRNIESVFNLARSYEAAGDLENAVRAFKSAAALKDIDPVVNMSGKARAAVQRLEKK